MRPFKTIKKCQTGLNLLHTYDFLRRRFVLFIILNMRYYLQFVSFNTCLYGDVLQNGGFCAMDASQNNFRFSGTFHMCHNLSLVKRLKLWIF
jgi:hypothetical protein